MMPNSDPRDRFVCPYLTVMMDFFLPHFFVPTLELITILLSGHVLGNSCPLGQQFVLIVFCLFVIFIYFPF